LVFLVNALIVLKNFFVFLALLTYKPIRIVLRFFFYKLVVKIYSKYLSFIKRIGWRGMQKGPLTYILGHKFVHIVVIFITFLLLFINVTAKTRADEVIEIAHNTILADLVQNEFEEFDQDDQLIVETFNNEALNTEINQSYLDSQATLKPQIGVSTEAPDDSGAVVPTVQSGNDLLLQEPAIDTRTARTRTETIVYAVEDGDTISTIAQKFEISASTIMWANNLSAYSIIRPGDELKILPMSGIVHKVVSGDSLKALASKYGVEENVILENNDIADASLLKIGDEVLVPGGKKSYAVPTATKSYTGITAITELVKGADAQPAPSSKMNWPTSGGTITQYYSWRHTGLDIANKTGTDLYAADAGTILVSGWGKGYGNYIDIDHGGGKKTRYGHLSQSYVTVGQTVSKGQVIGAMGSTGWSTGPHLHFEVMINGVKYNPLNYIR